MSSKSLVENNLSSSSTRCNHQQQMFPSNHSKNITPQAYAEQCLFGDQTFSKSGPVSSFFHLSPSYDHGNRFLNYDHELLSGQFTQFQQPLATANAITPTASEGVSNAAASTKLLTKEMAVLGTAQNFFANKNRSPNPVGRKRSSNRERHSKIFTAQGLRDRRMRLSVDVAHRFFGLQDMLGFDKASKTVEWLLTKSKATIKELTKGLSQTKGCGSDSPRGAYSTSESEDMSGIDETPGDVDQQESDLKQKSLAAAPKVKRIRQSQKATFCPVARESRAIARAKARERTREKMSKRLEKSKQLPKESTHEPKQLRPLSPLGSAEESGSHVSHDNKSLKLGVETNEPNKIGISKFDYHQHVTNSQGVNTSDLVTFHNSDVMNYFSENWDRDSTRTRSSCCDIPNMHLFADFYSNALSEHGNFSTNVCESLMEPKMGEHRPSDT